MTAPPETPKAIERALNETFPQLAPLRVAGILGSGFNSTAVETESGLVFRVAKVPGTAEHYALEACVLPAIRSMLPVAVPEPRWLVEQSERFPFGVSGYEKLPGRVLTPAILPPDSAALAASVAEALLAVHRIPHDALAHCRLPEYPDHFEYYRKLRLDTAPGLREHLTSDEFARIERWWDAFFADEYIAEFTPAIIHGDFWYENMLIDDNATKLLGVVDWEYVSVADPMVDFAHFAFFLGDDFRAQTIEAYRQAGGTFGAAEGHRMRRLWEAHPIDGFLYGMRHDPAELPDAISKLRAGPILAG